MMACDAPSTAEYRDVVASVSGAISGPLCSADRDCFVASLLAMTPRRQVGSGPLSSSGRPLLHYSRGGKMPREALSPIEDPPTWLCEQRHSRRGTNAIL